MIMQEQRPRAATVITVTNQKGGVGKTTNTIHLAAALGELGYKCLMIDLDATAGGTKRLGVPTEGWVNIYDVLTAGADKVEAVLMDAVITQDDPEVKLPAKFDLIPASRQLQQFEDWLSKRENDWVSRSDLLLEPIRILREQYDYIFLDTPPQFTKPMLPAYKASDFVLIATKPESEAVEAIQTVFEDFERALKLGNPDLAVLGVVVCAVPNPRTRLADYLINYIGELAKADGSSYRLDTVINLGVAIQEAAKSKTTIFQYEPEHKIATQYLELAEELRGRIEQHKNSISNRFNQQGVVNG